jgi:hypothetical protein
MVNNVDVPVHNSLLSTVIEQLLLALEMQTDYP